MKLFCVHRVRSAAPGSSNLVLATRPSNRIRSVMNPPFWDFVPGEPTGLAGSRHESIFERYTHLIFDMERVGAE